jgi:hypothetical protein
MTILHDTAACWFRKGETVHVSGYYVTGRIWTGHVMTIDHSFKEMDALLTACRPLRTPSAANTLFANL